MSVAWYAAPDVTITVKVVKQEFLGYEKNYYKRQKQGGGGAGVGGYWCGKFWE